MVSRNNTLYGLLNLSCARAACDAGLINFHNEALSFSAHPCQKEPGAMRLIERIGAKARAEFKARAMGRTTCEA